MSEKTATYSSNGKLAGWSRLNTNLQGAAFLVLALLIFSLQDVAVKWIGGDYSVLQIVVVRSVVALPCTLLFFHTQSENSWKFVQFVTKDL